VRRCVDAVRGRMLLRRRARRIAAWDGSSRGAEGRERVYVDLQYVDQVLRFSVIFVLMFFLHESSRDHTSRSGADDENGSTVLVARGAGLCVIRCVDGPIVGWMDAAQRDWRPRGDGLRAGGRC